MNRIETDIVEVELAGSWERIAAVILNYVFLLLSFLPLIVAVMSFEEGDKGSPWLLLLILPPLALQVYQLVLLCQHSYTLGKKMMGIQVVKRDGEPAGFVYAFLLREVVYAFAVSMAAGVIYMLLALFMFSDMLTAVETQNSEAFAMQYLLLMGVNQILNLIPPLICAVMLFTQSERRTLQDMIASTVVIKIPR